MQARTDAGLAPRVVAHAAVECAVVSQRVYLPKPTDTRVAVSEVPSELTVPSAMMRCPAAIAGLVVVEVPAPASYFVDAVSTIVVTLVYSVLPAASASAWTVIVSPLTAATVPS